MREIETLSAEQRDAVRRGVRTLEFDGFPEMADAIRQALHELDEMQSAVVGTLVELEAQNAQNAEFRAALVAAGEYKRDAEARVADLQELHAEERAEVIGLHKAWVEALKTLAEERRERHVMAEELSEALQALALAETAGKVKVQRDELTCSS